MKEERVRCDNMKDVTKECGMKQMVCCTECEESDVCRNRCYFTLVNGCKIGNYESK